MMRIRYVIFSVLFIWSALALSEPYGRFQKIAEEAETLLSSLSLQLDERQSKQGDNVLAPELGPAVEALKKALENDRRIQEIVMRANNSENDLGARAQRARAIRAYYYQVINQLEHVSFEYKIRDESYTHDFVLTGRYPSEPTRIAIKKALDFMSALTTEGDENITPKVKPGVTLDELMQEQWDIVKNITANSTEVYLEMRNRLKEGGKNVRFSEFGSLVEFLLIKLGSDEIIDSVIKNSPPLRHYFASTVKDLHDIREELPYMKTIEAVQKAMEFYDVVQRAYDPEKSPPLYHSSRYEYYGHYLKAQVPDHVLFPTLASLGATDILKSRGVPIGLIGVHTEISWVDGFYQTSFEFWLHDINHTRRMYQFFTEMAESLGLSIEEFALVSDAFVKEKVMPIFKISREDSDDEKNMKRLMKIIFFEIFHEDALAATERVVKEGILRPPKLITPFEELDDDRTTVTYIMEPGATTLAYVFRKLAHDFYDMPGDRLDNIVAPHFRTREKIVEASQIISKSLGFRIPDEVLEYFVSTDMGFPKDFKQTLANDIEERPDETVGLDKSTKMPDNDLAEIIAREMHSLWRNETNHIERWKPAHIVFLDGRGINDGFVVNSETLLQEYLTEREFAPEIWKHFKIDSAPQSDGSIVYENIKELDFRQLSPNNQYENIKSAMNTVEAYREIGAPSGRVFSSMQKAQDWLHQKMEFLFFEWYNRNKHWAKNHSEYQQGYQDLAGIFKVHLINLMKLGLEHKSLIDIEWLEPSQKVLLVEALRQIERDAKVKMDQDYRDELARGSAFNAWRSNLSESQKWQTVELVLKDKTKVKTAVHLELFFKENKLSADSRTYFSINKEGQVIVDIKNLGRDHIPDNLIQKSFVITEQAIDLFDELWSERASEIESRESAEKWLNEVIEKVHQTLVNKGFSSTQMSLAAEMYYLGIVEQVLEIKIRLARNNFPVEKIKILKAGLSHYKENVQYNLFSEKRACQKVLGLDGP